MINKIQYNKENRKIMNKYVRKLIYNNKNGNK